MNTRFRRQQLRRTRMSVTGRYYQLLSGSAAVGPYLRTGSASPTAISASGARATSGSPAATSSRDAGVCNLVFDIPLRVARRAVAAAGFFDNHIRSQTDLPGLAGLPILLPPFPSTFKQKGRKRQGKRTEKEKGTICLACREPVRPPTPSSHPQRAQLSPQSPPLGQILGLLPHRAHPCLGEEGASTVLSLGHHVCARVTLPGPALLNRAPIVLHDVPLLSVAAPMDCGRAAGADVYPRGRIDCGRNLGGSP